MGIFSRSSNNTGNTNDLPWTSINSVAQLDEVLQAPSENAKVFFKHSTRCGISAMALKGFQKEWETGKSGFELYFIDLLQHRDVSNAIADRLHVTHQSPQAIVVRNGEVIYHESHGSIDAGSIQDL